MNFNISRGSHISLTCFSCGFSILDESEFGDVGFCGGRITGEPESKARNNDKLNPHVAPTWHQTRATLIGDERSRHCTIPVSHHVNFEAVYYFLSAYILQVKICLFHHSFSSPTQPVPTPVWTRY